MKESLAGKESLLEVNSGGRVRILKERERVLMLSGPVWKECSVVMVPVWERALILSGRVSVRAWVQVLKEALILSGLVLVQAGMVRILEENLAGRVLIWRIDSAQI